MEKFNQSYRYRFLKVWLIAFACQTDHVFSQENFSSEDSWYPTFQASDTSYSQDMNPLENGHWPVYSKNDWDTTSDSSDSSAPYESNEPIQDYSEEQNTESFSESNIDNAGLFPSSDSFSETDDNEWSPQSNFRSEDRFIQPPRYSSENFENNEFDIQPSFNPPVQPLFDEYEYDYSQLPPTGNSSVMDDNQWLIQPQLQWNGYDYSPMPSTHEYRESDESQWQMQGRQMQGDFDWNEYGSSQMPPSYGAEDNQYPLTPESEYYETGDAEQDFYNFRSDTFETCDDMSSLCVPQIEFCDENSNAEDENVTIFDPHCIACPNDREQHPLSNAGKATSYSFDGKETHDSRNDPVTDEDTDSGETEHLENPEEPELENTVHEDSETDIPLSHAKKKSHEDLSHGTSNTKIIKKPHDERPIQKALDEKSSAATREDIADNASGAIDHKTTKRALGAPSIKAPKQSNSTNASHNRNKHASETAQLINPPSGSLPAKSTQGNTPATTTTGSGQNHQALKEISINFNNVAMIEYIRFISRISNKNFVFDDEDLQFNVTIVSEEPTSVQNLMAALLQELKIRDLSLIEQGNNIIIHRNPRVRAPARIVVGGTSIEGTSESELVTRVYRLNTLDPVKVSEIIRPLLSEDALVEVLRDSNNLILTDLVTNVNKISELIRNLDAPNSGVNIGQYVVRNAFVASLVDLANKILLPIAQGNPFVLVPHPVSNSIFIVSNTFIVEKALAILQNLDMNEGRTKIFSMDSLQPQLGAGEGAIGRQGRAGGRRGIGGAESGGVDGVGGVGGVGAEGEAIEGQLGRRGRGDTFGEGREGEREGPGGRLGRGGNGAGLPESFPLRGIGAEGRVGPIYSFEEQHPYPFTPGGIGTEGKPSAIFDETRDFLPGSIGAYTKWSNELPVGHIERTLFFIYKLRYRRGDQIEIALRKIAASLQLTGTANADLVSAINSSQWIESSNALIFTGTSVALEKVKELILEVDIPLRQVFIEMLILNATIDESLTYGVDWIDRFGGGNTTGEEGFIGLSGLANVVGSLPGALPIASGFVSPGLGFNAAIIGTHLTHNGTHYNTIGALVRAIHTDIKTDIVMNPKIITEDNNTAEIFVGGVDRYKTQSITNELGTLVTNNFQFIDVGTVLRVTPLIGNDGIITLDIVQETTTGDANANSTPNNQLIVDVNLVPVLTKTRTVTKVHVPDGFFVVLSGMIQDTESRIASRIPCLGGVPVIGAWGKTQTTAQQKKNLMIFIRPLIINNKDEDFEDYTQRQQKLWREQGRNRRSWNYEIDEALNFGNIKPTDRDEIGCDE